jgi:hypothetical protein
MYLLEFLKDGDVIMDYILCWLSDNSKWITSIANICVCISAVFVGIQAKLFFDDYKKKNKKAEFETSFKLTDFYINKIIPKFEIISFVFQYTGVDKIISSKLKNEEIFYFDKEEFQKIFDEETLENLIDKVNKVDLSILLFFMGKIYDNNICTLENYYHDYLKKFEGLGKEEQEQQKAKFKSYLIKDFWGIITSAKNEIEYFSMYFNSNLAESAVVYDSLHQTFTDFVKMIYPFIAHHNSRSECTRKYFTNTRELYLKWVNEEKNKLEENKKVLEKMQNKNSKDKKI